MESECFYECFFVVLLEWKNFVETFNEISIPDAFHKTNIFAVVVAVFGTIKRIVNRRHHNIALRRKTIYILHIHMDSHLVIIIIKDI